MKRIIIIGSPGAGKSTFARRLRDKLGLPLFYLDMIYHKPDKTTLSKEEFDKQLNGILGENAWIIDGNYSRTMEQRFLSCDTVFFLDFPVETCLSGAKSRIGQVREDMPWTEEVFDEEFKKRITDFPERELPKINELIKKHCGRVKIYRFQSRDDIENFLKVFNI